MVRISLLAFVSLLSLMVTGCSSSHQSGQAGGGQTSGAPKDASDWSYTPPEGFQEQKQQTRGDTVFLGPTEDGFTSNLRVKGGTNNRQSSEQVGKEILQKITAQSGVTVKEQEPYSLSDSDAYTWLISKTGKSGKVASQRQFVVMKNGVVVLFTMTASDKSIGKWDQALADSLKSFHWGR